MLISHRYKFLYTKTAKTAGTSVESFFEPFCMPEGEWEQQHGRDEYESDAGVIGFRGPDPPADLKWRNHMSAAEIRALAGPEVWDGYFKFCVVRNPFDKCVSAFEHFGRNHAVKRRPLLSRFTARNMTEEQYRFLDYLKTKPLLDRDKYVIDGEFCLDDVIKFENLQGDIERICGTLGLPYDADRLPTFKKGLRREGATCEALYTPQSRKIVEETFAYELKQFDYAFPTGT